MYTELYLPRNGSSFAETSGKDFEDTVKKLSESDVNIVYKTEVDLTAQSIGKALQETSSGEDLIDLIFIADALNSDDPAAAKEVFYALGLEHPVKTIEAAKISKEQLHAPTEKGSTKSNTIVTEEAPGMVVETPAKPALMLESDKPQSTEKPEEKNTITAFSVVHQKKLVILLPTREYAGAELSTILCSVAMGIVRPKQKPAFWKRFIPCQGDRPFDVVRKVILLLAICTFIVSSCMLVNILVLEPASNDNTNDSIRSMLVSTPESEGSEETQKPTDGSQGVLVDFSKLYAENKDTIGWIKVPNTIIDHVVVKPQEGEDPEYYLYRDFYGNDTKYGTVFMDYRSNLDSKNMILHGHHMTDGRMFANLKHYEDLDFYKSAPVFTFNTIYEKSQWKIVSIFKTNTLDYQGQFFNYLRGSFYNDYDFLNFIYQVRERSIIDCPVTVNEHDTIVTLSTCSYDFEEFRLVIVARKVRDGETETVDIAKAKRNDDPLYPDIWYYSYDDPKPEVTTFQDAYNHKKINWYDGTRKSFSEADDKELTKTLDEGKKKAAEMINKYIEGQIYEEADKASVRNLADQYIELINSAVSGQEINELYETAMNDLKQYKTISQKEASDREASAQELKNKKESAKVEVHNSIAGNSYRPAELQQVEKLFTEYNEKIDKAKTLEELEKLKKEGIEKLARIKTDEDLTKEASDKKAAEEASKKAVEESSKKAAEEASKRAAEEASKKAAEEASQQAVREASERAAAEALKKAKDNAKVKISGLVNKNDYYPEQQEEIQTIINRYMSIVENAANPGTADAQIARAKTELSQVKTKAQIDAEQAEDSSEPESSQEPEPSEVSQEESTEPEPEPEPAEPTD